MLIVIDMQEKYLSNYDIGLLDRVNCRIAEARAKDEKIVYVKNIGNFGNREKYELADRLSVMSDLIFEKDRPSAFTSDLFLREVAAEDVKVMELVGIDGTCCVKKTALDAVNKGFDVIWNESCIGRRNAEIYEKTRSELKKAGVRFI